MNQPMPAIAFRGMTLLFKLRDLFVPRRKVLQEAGLKPGDSVLDFGCGPGAYVADAASTVGPAGRVYAVDIHPLAVRQVSKMAETGGLKNIRVIHSDCDTGLPNGTVDVVLLQDTFHLLDEPQRVLAELHRVLKPGGVLSFSDHHMSDEDILAGMAGNGLFRLGRRGTRTYTFLKEGPKT